MQTNCPAVLVVTTVLHAGRWCLTFGGHGHHGGPAAQRCSCSLGSTAPRLHSHPTVYSGSSLRSTMRPTRGSASSEISVECCVEAVM